MNGAGVLQLTFLTHWAKVNGMALFLMLVAVTCAPSPASAATIRDDQPASAYLDLAQDPDYMPVGLLVNSWGYTGSATLIAPDWILTAAHNLMAATAATFTINGISYVSARFIVNPGWNGDALHGSDLALVHLATPVAGVAPAALYTGSDEFGQTGTFVGYGFTGTGLTGSKSLDNRIRAFQNVIDGDFGNASIVLGSDFDNPHSPADNSFGSSVGLTLEGCAALGDSGGGVFLKVGSKTYLAGVISFVGATDGSSNSDYGDVTGFGRTSAFAPWIASQIPEPSTSLLLVMSSLVILVKLSLRPRKSSTTR